MRCEWLNIHDECIQEAIWKIGETIGSREGRFDVGVAAAGILKDHIDCLKYPAKGVQEVSILIALGTYK